MTAVTEAHRGGVRPARSQRPALHPRELIEDRARALALTPVSRETAERLDRYVALLLERQRQLNLIAVSTETMLWTRHIADSLQLLDLVPDARIWADLGSGAGFPGLVVACALGGRGQVHLVESGSKKAAFLREAVRVTGAPAIVHVMRAEVFAAQASGIEVVTARAFAPLPKLLRIAYPLLIRNAVGLFPKGQAVASELTEAARYWNIQASLIPSRTDPAARVVVVRGIAPLQVKRGARSAARSARRF